MPQPIMAVEQKITPWEAEVTSTDDRMISIDYDKIITQFGCEKFERSLISELEEITGSPAHYLLRRNIVFAHRDFRLLLEELRKGGSFFLYTGRGPSSESMHLGHAIPLLLCKYIQDTFNIPFVVQVTDDEKFLWKSLELDESMRFGKENIKDIIAFGLNPRLTYIFSNVESCHFFEENILKVSKVITLNEAMKVFGFDMSSNIGQVAFPAREIAPCFSSSFKFLEKGMMCLVPAAVDQDPYFRLARDKAGVLGERKPSSIYVSLLPSLKGVNRKMSASDANSSIYLTDTPEEISKKIKKYAFSGGRKTFREHREMGGDAEVDVPYQYLRYFLEDDSKLEEYREGYVKGTVSSGEMKAKCTEVIQKFVADYQEARRRLTDEDIRAFMDVNKL
jgi:tryptophanyl-tRNA synthetase